MINVMVWLQYCLYFSNENQIKTIPAANWSNKLSSLRATVDSLKVLQVCIQINVAAQWMPRFCDNPKSEGPMSREDYHSHVQSEWPIVGKWQWTSNLDFKVLWMAVMGWIIALQLQYSGHLYTCMNNILGRHHYWLSLMSFQWSYSCSQFE